MEDIVAIKIIDDSENAHYFITWGRIFDAVDPESLLQAVAMHLSKFGIKTFNSIELCSSLQEAANQTYFYEALFSFSQRKIRFGKNYESWRKKRKKKIRSGREIYYLGRPNF